MFSNGTEKAPTFQCTISCFFPPIPKLYNQRVCACACARVRVSVCMCKPFTSQSKATNEPKKLQSVFSKFGTMSMCMRVCFFPPSFISIVHVRLAIGCFNCEIEQICKKVRLEFQHLSLLLV